MANISKKLLQKYFTGTCSSNEKRIVEAWLESDEYDEPLTLSEKVKTSQKQQMWDHIMNNMDAKTGDRLNLFYKRLAKYAAVACLLVTIFVGGRFSVNTGYAKSDSINQIGELHIYGGNGSYARIGGEKYKLRFDGTLKLFNGSDQSKLLICGAKEYRLEPFNTYLLTGSHNDPGIINLQYNQEFARELKGDFSINIIRDQQ